MSSFQPLVSTSRLRLMRVPSLVFGALLLAACQDSPTGPPAARSSLAPPSLARGESRAERAFEFSQIRVPGALFTGASGINAGGDIVGTYVDAAGRAHGYLLSGGTFTTIDYPGSVSTGARGIGPGGEIVGDYRLPGEAASRIHGFVLTRQGEFVRVDSEGHLNTIAQRILADGTVLGCRHDNDMMASMRGMVVSREGYEETDVFASMHNGATPNGRHIVGLYTNMMAGGRVEGYRIDDGVFTALLVPNSIFTAAWDINPPGEIVGVYRDAAQRFHGFVLRDGEYVPIDYPGATATRAFGINARGDVVGNYVAGGKTYGYLARR